MVPFALKSVDEIENPSALVGEDLEADDLDTVRF